MPASSSTAPSTRPDPTEQGAVGDAQATWLQRGCLVASRPHGGQRARRGVRQGRVAQAHRRRPPEANVRAPIEALLANVAAERGVSVVLSDEDSLPRAGVRPDWSIHVHGALAGYVEAKAPGKGADLKHFTGHDAEQWERLQDLPNLLLTDGIEWALYRDGRRIEPGIVRFSGSLDDDSAQLVEPQPLSDLVERLVSWQPLAPQSAGELAETAARLCRLLRKEVARQLQLNDQLHHHAEEWRELLFANADDDTFADGFAQTITFALLRARVEKVEFPTGDPSGEQVHRISRAGQAPRAHRPRARAAHR